MNLQKSLRKEIIHATLEKEPKKERKIYVILRNHLLEIVEHNRPKLEDLKPKKIPRDKRNREKSSKHMSARIKGPHKKCPRDTELKDLISFPNLTF